MLLNRGAFGTFNGDSPGGDWPLVLDFENGSYTSANDTYALEDVWESDTDWGNGGSLAKLVPGTGLVVDEAIDDQWFHFSDTFVELVAAGPIVVLDFGLTSDADGSNILAFGYDTVDFNEAEARLSNSASDSWIKDNAANTTPLVQLTSGDHKYAALMSNARIAVSVDGGAVVGVNNPSPTVFERIGVAITNANPGQSLVLRSATFRDPAEGEAALTTLSAL